MYFIKLCSKVVRWSCVKSPVCFEFTPLCMIGVDIGCFSTKQSAIVAVFKEKYIHVSEKAPKMSMPVLFVKKDAIGRKPSVIILEADCKEECYWCRSVLLHSQMCGSVGTYSLQPEWLSTFTRFAVIEIVLSNWSTSWIFSVVYGLQLRKGNKLFAATRKGITYTPWVENCGKKTGPWWNY